MTGEGDEMVLFGMTGGRIRGRFMGWCRKWFSGRFKGWFSRWFRECIKKLKFLF